MKRARTIRRLGPGDERLLAKLAREDASFNLGGRGHALKPLSPKDARDFLSDRNTLQWVEEEGEVVWGYLYCCVVRLRAGAPRELFLYEIGVHKSRRREGVGRRLLDAMFGWMRANGVAEAWVLADNAGAVKFYRACGFKKESTQAVYMTARARSTRPRER